MLQKILEKLRFILKTFLVDLLYPRRCPSCKKIVGSDGFCRDCWEKLIFIDKPFCSCCGKKLISAGQNFLCPDCIIKKNYFDQNVSVFIYNHTIAKAIFEFKFKRKLFLSKNFSIFMKNKLKDIIYSPIDYIICVPMAKSRLRKRGFNHSLLLARELSKLSNVIFIGDALIKVKNTKTQVGLNYGERKKNLKNSFMVKDKYIKIFKDKNILIVDDVFTTGSTINECAKVLKVNGKVNKVVSITIAKTHRNTKEIEEMAENAKRFLMKNNI